MEDMKTGYEWCLEKQFQIIHPKEWNRTVAEVAQDSEAHYCLTPITEEDFDSRLSRTGWEIESIPYKPDWFLELRMYSLVPYNIMGIQKGIQHEHSVTDYVKNYVLGKFEQDELFKRWATEWKTTIILNGGTSNEGHMVRHGFRYIKYIGTMQQHLDTLEDNGIKVSTFYEPDLNSMLTATSFIVDERVFNKRLYPNFVPIEIHWDLSESITPTPEEIVEWEGKNEIAKEKWVKSVGGEKNVFLRDFLKDFRLA